MQALCTQVPLEEIMQKILKPEQLSQLLSGPHTHVRIDPPLAGGIVCFLLYT